MLNSCQDLKDGLGVSLDYVYYSFTVAEETEAQINKSTLLNYVKDT